MLTLPAPPERDRLEQLVSEKCNGSLSPEGHGELYGMLDGSAELRAEYWDMISFHTDLHWVIAHREIAVAESGVHFVQAVAELATNSKSEQDKSTTRATIRDWWGPALAAGILTVLLSGWSLWQLNKYGSEEQVAGTEPLQTRTAADRSTDQTPQVAAPPKIGVAVLSSLVENSTWNCGRPGARNIEEMLFGDTVCVERGLVEMRLEGGAIAILRAPAILEVLSENRIRLLAGRIRVTAPELTDGFAVETPSAEVIDLGTEFSVEAAETGTDLVVHDGKVDLKLPIQLDNANTQPAKTKQFTTGQAVHIDVNGTLSRIMYVRADAHPEKTNEASCTPLITSVTDNIVRGDHWAFYEVVVGGMTEDALAYVDRSHQWNGATPSGIPSYLVGGDYVKMFNDDKLMEDYRVEVALDRPATLYILLDSRVSTPKWLEDSFSWTGDTIGVDEDHRHKYPDHPKHAGVGPGNSIEFTHSIWKMVAPEGGTFVLGPNGKSRGNKGRENPWHANMYGIVAVPLEETE